MIKLDIKERTGTAVAIGYAPEKSKNCPYFIQTDNGLTSTFKTLEKLRYELRNTWQHVLAEKDTQELKYLISEHAIATNRELFRSLTED